MSQPLPHAIMRWQIRHYILVLERAKLVESLANAAHVQESKLNSSNEQNRIEIQLQQIDQQLRDLGPDPSAKMG